MKLWRNLHFVKTLRRKEDGVAAMEFALLAPVFFVLMFGIIEVALVFFADMMLQNALLDASRLVRTGYAAGAIQKGVTVDKTAFVDAICKKAFILHGCNSKLKYQVTVLTDYKTYEGDLLIGNYEGLLKIKNEYNIGAAEDIMLVRAYYEWDMYTGYIRNLFSTPGSNVRVIGGAVVFRNEPY